MITEETLKNWTGSLLENDRSIIGFYFLSTSPPDAELERLYVAHQLIGQGNGRRLFHIAAQTALDRNCRTIRIEADVNAVPFYERMGAIQTGCYFPDIDARYKLAELEYRLA
ncbi:GNAT family N-acetyltransferase [uncultured Sneathiella sp.]|uniref:GNAT family N-acetyltransferase n=1 Tax=uncultured Sneathiella sp. TaxID=879315 RepID=UPI0030D9D891|tara:strand:- start:148 stop:483 length:336 start_codon:yes stop_codon:yes gene_type:complete